MHKAKEQRLAELLDKYEKQLEFFYEVEQGGNTDKLKDRPLSYYQKKHAELIDEINVMIEEDEDAMSYFREWAESFIHDRMVGA